MKKLLFGVAFVAIVALAMAGALFVHRRHKAAVAAQAAAEAAQAAQASDDVNGASIVNLEAPLNDTVTNDAT